MRTDFGSAVECALTLTVYADSDMSERVPKDDLYPVE